MVLLAKPRELNENTLSALVCKALGTEQPKDNLVVAKPPYYLIKLKSGSYVINNVAEPYVEEDDSILADIKDPELRKALTAHHAWVSIDLAGKDEPAEALNCYQDMGKIAAALAGKDALAIYNPDTDEFALYSEPVIKSLCCEDPLKAFAANSDIVSIADDNPGLKAAHAEAKKGWPGFVKAFREKAGSAFAVKGRITEGDETEYIWLTVEAIDEEKVHGQLDSEPDTITNLKTGQDLHIKIDDVDDYIYLTAEKKPVGGFTILVFDNQAQTPAKGGK